MEKCERVPQNVIFIRLRGESEAMTTQNPENESSEKLPPAPLADNDDPVPAPSEMNDDPVPAPSEMKDDPAKHDMVIVGVGASAGGLEALQEFLANLPEYNEKVAFIVAQHLSPTYKSMLVQLLSRATKLQVVEITHGMPIESGKVFITPPDSEVSVSGGKLKLNKPGASVGPKPSVNVFFSSLAQQQKIIPIGVILSGTGSDGAKGVQEIKRYGGLTIAQEPKTAKYDGMPLAAIQTGFVDLALSPDKMGEEIKDYLIHGASFLLNHTDEDSESSSLDSLLKMLSDRTGTDFSNYKPSTICRRLEKRIAGLNLESIDDYVKLIRKRPRELDVLFNTILIGVTAFFRDPDAYERLRERLREIVVNKRPNEPIRIWCPGCATGEEPYSIAIMLSQLLKDKVESHNIQIFATDIDDQAIAFARRGAYHKSSLENLSADIIAEYFHKRGDKYELRKSIRQLALFSKHDVTVHPPFLKLDLISCRNLLIYFGQKLQKHIIPVFHYALNSDGYLFLGKSETVGQFTSLFSTVDGKNKIFRRKQGGSMHAVKFSSFRSTRQLRPADADQNRRTAVAQQSRDRSLSEMVMETIYSTFEHPFVVVNDAMDIQEIRGDIGPYLQLREGQMNANIVNLANKDYQIELRSLLSKSIRERSSVKGAVKRKYTGDNPHLVRIAIKPLLFNEVNDELFLVVFERLDLDENLFVHADSSDAKGDDPRVIELEQELAATKEHLQTYIEEIETANEELQSLNEELQSSNEELQSSNEELETSNEELQSSNEEIQIAYAELRLSNQELEKKERALQESETNMRALLNNTLQSFVLVDRNYRMVVFNKSAREFAERRLGVELKSGESVIDFIKLLRDDVYHEAFLKALGGSPTEMERSTKGVDGSERRYIFNFTPILDAAGEVEVISLSIMDITERYRTQRELDENRRIFQTIFDHVDVGVAVVDDRGETIQSNDTYTRIFGFDEGEPIGAPFTDAMPKDRREEARSKFQSFIEKGTVIDGEYKGIRRDGELIDVHINFSRVEGDGDRDLTILTVRDVTKSVHYRHLLEDSQRQANVGGWEFDVITGTFSWTEEVFRIYDVPPDTPITLDLGKKHYHPDSLPKLEAALERALERGDPYDLELKFVSAKNVEKWVRATCKPIRVHDRTVKLFGTIQDITGRKESERRAYLLSYAAEFAKEFVLFGNRDGVCEWANDAFLKATDATLDDLRGKTIDTIFAQYAPRNSGVKEKVERLRRSHAGESEIILFHKNHDGDPRWLKTAVVELDDVKTGSALVALAFDVTDQRRKQTRLALQKRKVEALSRYKARRFSLAGEKLKKPAERARSSETKPNEEIEELLRIFESVEELAPEANEPERMQPSDFYPGCLLAELTQIFRPDAAQRRGGLEFANNAPELPLNLDRRSFSLAVYLLLDYLFDRRSPAPLKISMNVKKDGDKRYGLVEIVDKDAEMDEETRERFRGAIETGDETGGAVMLPVIARELVTKMGGEASFVFEEGVGAKFEFSFVASVS
ncbi:MAG: PAS domain S-box protein [Ignavibacteriales bacterium]|nr:PAS domain S-box protein [Ignavibacteriales bacterium]